MFRESLMSAIEEEGCYRLNGVSPNFICWSPYTQNLRMWLDLETRLLKKSFKLKWSGSLGSTETHQGQTGTGEGPRKGTGRRRPPASYGDRPQHEPDLPARWPRRPASGAVRKHISVISATRSAVLCSDSPSNRTQGSSREKLLHWRSCEGQWGCKLDGFRAIYILKGIWPKVAVLGGNEFKWKWPRLWNQACWYSVPSQSLTSCVTFRQVI